ncbi:hypothetical protein BABINDRAFT_159489 [Babjeviella inositovora NRRL Y-12698]|uniref:Uncharacterized protein n=1 Tax=Babjeviella inositovora NRRL Y-12698 TaxID=984486 RepID=A0A1E3QZG8_9ASCO|nr:uncharacterized protein BABINDRAFT_159489 [Babjeviella inositovora NRRL Y-12698]ODQ83011.1 hypothetical protein BABINDRAFT_159489 [Babjeviella inositovora NRRL Y-12698]
MEDAKKLKKHQTSLIVAGSAHHAHFKRCLNHLMNNVDEELQLKLSTIHSNDATIQLQMAELSGQEMKQLGVLSTQCEKVLAKYSQKTRESSRMIQNHAEAIDQKMHNSC